LTTPTDIDLRDLVGDTVLDQGLRPTCVPFAASAVHEATRTRSGAARAHLSPEAIWHTSVQRQLAGHGGMALMSATGALEDDGQPLLDDWPYNNGLGPGTEDAPVTAGSPPWSQATLQRLPLLGDGIEAGIEAALAAGRAVILVVEVTDEFEMADHLEGHIAIPNIRAKHGGYHAVACVGARTDPDRGRLLLIKNSWGTDWGVAGYGWLPPEYLVAFGAEAAIVVGLNGATP
jgi:C1A family cysteine protease